MSRLLIGISGMALMVAGIIKAMELVGVIEGPVLHEWFFWVFMVLSIPFLMLFSGAIFILMGAVLLSPFVGLNYLDESFEYEGEE